MSNKGKLSNLSQVEKSIKEKHGPDKNEAANSPDDKDIKEAKANMQSEGEKK